MHPHILQAKHVCIWVWTWSPGSKSHHFVIQPLFTISSTSQLLSQVAHIWQDPSISTAVAASGSPQLSWARNQLILWSCSSRRYARVPPVTLGVDILEISVELILIHRVMDLTSNNSRIWGSFTRLWDSEGFILIRDILLLSLWPLGAFGQSWEGGQLAKSECCDL